MTALKCKHCGGTPINYKHGKVYVAKCQECGYKVKHIEETAMVFIERVKLEKAWNFDQIMPIRAPMKRYFK